MIRLLLSDSLVGVGSVAISVAGSSTDEVSRNVNVSGLLASSVAGASAEETTATCSDVSASCDPKERIGASVEDSSGSSLEVSVWLDSPGSTTERITDLGFLISRFNRTSGEIPIKA